DLLVDLTLLLNLRLKLSELIKVVERFESRVDGLGDNKQVILIRHQYMLALLWTARYPDAAITQKAISSMAGRLGTPLCRAYAIAGDIHISTMLSPMTVREYEALRREVVAAASKTADAAYIQNWSLFVIGWEDFHRGRMIDARSVARELLEVGRRIGDP